MVITVPGASVTAAGTFVTLNCTAVAAGKTSSFVLSNVVVGNKDAVALPLDTPSITQVAVALASDINLDRLG